MAAQVSRKDQYLGEIRKHLRDGYGVYNYSNRFFRYEGEWQDGKKHGHGKLIMADGSYYEGEFNDGEIEGNGFRYYASNANEYSGEFHQGELHGNGVMNYANGTVYEGEWSRNKRQGYGILKEKNGCAYDGQFFEHKRHGEGTQTYLNGDNYSGCWVQDKRQGHGCLQCSDGTIYEGQWRNDLQHGQGKMAHCSGFIYDGLWVNGKPAVMATKLVIAGVENNELDLFQNETFVITVETHDETGEVIEDHGREIQIMAGYKFTPPKEGSALFDLIEDIEEKPIPTPYGYDIASYPLTDQLPDESLLGDKSQTTLTEQVIPEDDVTEPEQTDKKPEQDEAPDGDTLEPPAADVDNPSSRQESPVLDGSTVITSTDQTETVDATPLPPPVSNQRSDMGQVLWKDLILPPPPPMYRPFAVTDDASSSSLSSKKSKSKSKTAAKKDDDGKSVSSKKSSSSTDSKAALEEKYARPGEYVIVVQDVTNPPFLGVTLEPAFLLIKLKKKKKIIHKKVKKHEPKL